MVPTVMVWPAQLVVSEGAIVTTGAGVMFMVCETGKEEHPFCATVSVTVLLPEVAQLTFAGPCVFPGVGVPPPTFHVYVAAGGAGAVPE